MPEFTKEFEELSLISSHSNKEQLKAKRNELRKILVKMPKLKKGSVNEQQYQSIYRYIQVKYLLGVFYYHLNDVKKAKSYFLGIINKLRPLYKIFSDSQAAIVADFVIDTLEYLNLIRNGAENELGLFSTSISVGYQLACHASDKLSLAVWTRGINLWITYLTLLQQQGSFEIQAAVVAKQLEKVFSLKQDYTLKELINLNEKLELNEETIRLHELAILCLMAQIPPRSTPEMRLATLKEISQRLTQLAMLTESIDSFVSHFGEGDKLMIDFEMHCSIPKSAADSEVDKPEPAASSLSFLDWQQAVSALSKMEVEDHKEGKRKLNSP